MLLKHVEVVSNFGNCAGMSLGLPELGLYVLQIAFSSANIDLIEGSIYWHPDNTSLSLPKGLQNSVVVFSDCICAGIPKADLFEELIADGII
jgi:hypothetical protein